MFLTKYLNGATILHITVTYVFKVNSSTLGFVENAKKSVRTVDIYIPGLFQTTLMLFEKTKP